MRKMFVKFFISKQSKKFKMEYLKVEKSNGSENSYTIKASYKNVENQKKRYDLQT